MSANQKTGYKYSIRFDQSLTSGTIAIKGDMSFDDIKDFAPNVLVGMLQQQEECFKDAGYRVASVIAGELQKMGDKKQK